MRRIHLKPAYLLIPIVLSLLAAAFEGIGLGLLVPLLNGFLERDYSFVQEIPLLSDLLALLPTAWISTDRALFGVLAATFVIATILKNILKYLSTISVTYLASRAEHHLRKYLFEAYLHLGQEYFDATSVGQHSTVLLQFTKQAVMPLLISAKFFQALFPLVAYFVVTMLISWQLTLLAVPVFVILHFVTRVIIRRIQEYSASIAAQGKALGQKVVDILSAVRLVRTSQTQVEERVHYALLSDEAARLEFRKGVYQHLMQPSQELITLFAGLFLFAAMLALLVYGGVGESSQLLVYFYIVVNAGTKFSALSSVRGDIASQAPYLAEILRIFDESKHRVVPSGAREFHGLKDRIALRNLQFSYKDGVEALKGVSLEVPRGSRTALVGETGSGKSTVFNLLLRMYDCPPGAIFLDGIDIRAYSTSSILQHVALVSQETLLFRESLKHNITYGVGDVAERDLKDAIARARLTDLMEKLPDGLDTVVGDRGATLSGGERQRIAIARALLKKADIFLLDEPTSALDTQTEQLVQQAIDDAVKGKTVLVIAHRLATVRSADQIVVLKDGRNVEQGTHDELKEKGGAFAELLVGQELG